MTARGSVQPVIWPALIPSTVTIGLGPVTLVASNRGRVGAKLTWSFTGQWPILPLHPDPRVHWSHLNPTPAQPIAPWTFTVNGVTLPLHPDPRLHWSRLPRTTKFSSPLGSYL